MKKIFYLLCLILCLSCSNEKEADSIYVHPNLGRYNLVSYVSNTPIDLNFDGIKSTNFRFELDIYFRNPIYNALDALWLDSYNLENPREIEVQSMNLPQDNFQPLLERWNRFGYGNAPKTIYIKPNSDEVDFIKHYHGAPFIDDNYLIYTDKYPFAYDVKFLNKNNITIKIKQIFYNDETAKWDLVLLEAKFVRK